MQPVPPSQTSEQDQTVEVETTEQEYFDREALQDAQTILKNRFPQVLQGYLEDTEGYIDHIEEHLKRCEYEQVFRYAHPLKASSEALGIIRLAKIARAIEHSARNASKNEDATIPNAKQLLQSLQQTYKYVRPLLEQLLKQS